MINITAWIKAEQGKHFCKCGCGGVIKITEKHYYGRKTKYLRGHNPNPKKGKTKKCLYCGKSFYVISSLYKIRKFDSIICRQKYLVGINAPGYKNGGVEKICIKCGKKFTTTHAAIRQNGGKFCSKKCAVLSYIKKIKFFCRYCKKAFFLPPSRLKRTGYFCSKKCADKARYSKICKCCKKPRNPKHKETGYCDDCFRAKARIAGGLQRKGQSGKNISFDLIRAVVILTQTEEALNEHRSRA